MSEQRGFFSNPFRRRRKDATSENKPKKDGWVNPVTGHGRRGKDKSESGYYEIQSSCELDMDELGNLYHYDWLAQRIASQPAMEMTRKFIEFTDDGPGRDRVSQEFKRLKVRSILRKAITFSRAYGTALVFIDANDRDRGNLDLPLVKERAPGIKSLTVFTPKEARVKDFYTAEDGKLSKIGQPKSYEVTFWGGMNIAPKEIHESRFIRFDGTETSDVEKHENKGWSISVFEQVYEAMRSYGMTWKSVSVLMMDLQQSVLKIQGLYEMLNADNCDNVENRLDQVELFRSVNKILPIDTEEEWERKPTSFSGIPEMLTQINLLVASAANIPARRLFWHSSGGLGASGAADFDQKMYYDEISASQEDQLRDPINDLLALLGEPSLEFSFVPLFQMSEKDQAEIMRIVSEADRNNIASEVYLPEEVAVSRYGGDEFSLNITLDEGIDRAGIGSEPGAGEE